MVAASRRCLRGPRGLLLQVVQRRGAVPAVLVAGVGGPGPVPQHPPGLPLRADRTGDGRRVPALQDAGGELLPQGGLARLLPQVVLLQRVVLQVEELRAVAVVVGRASRGRSAPGAGTSPPRRRTRRRRCPPTPPARGGGLRPRAPGSGGAPSGAAGAPSSPSRLLPAISGRAGACAASRMVAVRSRALTTRPQRWPAGRAPGQETMAGTRAEASYIVCFHHRPCSPACSPWSVV